MAPRDGPWTAFGDIRADDIHPRKEPKQKYSRQNGHHSGNGEQSALRNPKPTNGVMRQSAHDERDPSTDSRDDDQKDGEAESRSCLIDGAHPVIL